MIGDMMRSCCVTDTYSPGDKPGDETLATDGAKTHAKTLAKKAANVTAVTTHEAVFSASARAFFVSVPFASFSSSFLFALTPNKHPLKTLCTGPFKPPSVTKTNKGINEACACASTTAPTPNAPATHVSRAKPISLQRKARIPTEPTAFAVRVNVVVFG
jgi:hypothetical protein